MYAQYQVSFLDDKIHYKDINQVLNKKFLPTTNKETFGKKKYLWLKVDIKNITNKKENNYLSFRNIQVLKDVHFYTVIDDKVVKQNKSFHTYKNPNVNHRMGNILFFNNEIMPNQKIEVYIYITAMSNIFYEINNGTLTEVVSKASRSSAILVILIGILVALGIYYLFLYIFTPNKEYIYYTLLMASVSIWGFYIYGGYAYYFDILNIRSFASIFMVFLPMFTTLFFQSIYKDNLEFKKYNKILNIFVYVLFLYFIYIVLGKLGLYELHFKVTAYLAYIYIINLVTILVIGIIIYLRKFPYSGIVLLAFIVNMIGVITSISFFRAKLPYTELTFHANMIGSSIEAILFSILLTYKMRQVYKEKDEAISATKIQGLRLSILSETIDFISHQWRQPLSLINASVMALDDILHSKNIKNKELDKELVYIEDITKHMSTTIDDFRNLFSQKKQEVFPLDLVLSNTLSLVQKSLKNNNINLEIQMEEELYIKGAKGDISQVLLVIINNAKDAFLEKEIKDSKINIKLSTKNDLVILQVCDNAGGIDEKIKDKIFNAHYTTKDKINGSGLGLYIAKMIIETKMKGSLYIKDIDNGTCFFIELKRDIFNNE